MQDGQMIAASIRRCRLMALRAIMDARGVDVLVLRDATIVDFCMSGAGLGRALVITAGEARLVAPCEAVQPPAGHHKVISDDDPDLAALVRKTLQI